MRFGNNCMLAAYASLLEVTKSALADAVVAETEACTAHDQRHVEVKEHTLMCPRKDLGKAQNCRNHQSLKRDYGSILNSTAAQFMLMLYFTLVRRGNTPNSAVQKAHGILGISRSRV